METPLKLNIGAGDLVEIEGFTPIDRKFGVEAYPLDYADESVDEIGASHVLEHFNRRDSQLALQDWVRVLKTGSLIRIAVPDARKLQQMDPNDPMYEGYQFGGQMDENDYHRSSWTEEKLRKVMENAGLRTIRRWESPNTDCTSLPISLNLEGFKAAKGVEVKTRAVMSVPRYGSLAARGILENALRAHQIPLDTSQGVFWGQCLQRQFESAVRDEIDVLLCVDFDTLCTADHISQLLRTLVMNDEYDCVAALEPRRNGDRPLMTVGGAEDVVTDGTPIKVTTAHFGLTAIRVESLADLPKPWFVSKPDESGEWGDDRLDDDIWFWHQWRLAEKNIYVDPQVRIGHLEETCSFFDEDLQVQRSSIPEWRKANL